MLNIQSAMLVVLGFLAANLLVLLLAPAYWRRAVRLTTAHLKQSMPLTESEIRADKDKLRAEYAIKVQRLEAKAEQSQLASARQQIELNRRDAAISALEGELSRLKTSLDEHENARRVLEQTITDRFPRVEQRLNEARRLLAQRDQEVGVLTESTTRQARALDQTTQLATQQRDELMRLNSTLTALSTRTREGLSDPKFDAEVALRTELETLRAKLREQAGSSPRAGAANGAASALNGLGLSVPAPSSSQPHWLAAVSAGKIPEKMQKALALARSEVEVAQSARSDLDKQLREARSSIEDKDVEIARMKAALAAYERGSSEDRSVSLKDSRIAMKVRIGSLQAETEKQSAAIQRMRGEIASANEKLAKQAAHFMSEMRRLGMGGSGAAGSANGAARAEAGEAKRNGSETAVRIPALARIADAERPSKAAAGAVLARMREAAGGGDGQDASRVRGFLKALGGNAAVRGLPPPEPAKEVAAQSTAPRETATATPSLDSSKPDTQPRRLADRLSATSKT